MERLQQLQMDKRPADTVCVPETSRSAVLLFLQKDGRETGRPPLLPGLTMAAQGVHASPKVTISSHVDEYLSFLVEGTWAALQEGAAIGSREQMDFLGHICANYAQHSRGKTHQARLETDRRIAVSLRPP